MPVSFVHCNYCGESPSKDVKFVITSCRHVACGECYSAGRASPICMLCNRPCRVQAINSKMKNKEMFMDQAFTVQRLINQIKSRVTEEDDVQEVSMEENELSDAEKDACLLLENSVALEQFNQRLDDIFLMADKAISSNKAVISRFTQILETKSQGSQTMLDLRFSSNCSTPTPVQSKTAKSNAIYAPKSNAIYAPKSVPTYKHRR